MLDEINQTVVRLVIMKKIKTCFNIIPMVFHGNFFIGRLIILFYVLNDIGLYAERYYRFFFVNKTLFLYIS